MKKTLLALAFTAAMAVSHRASAQSNVYSTAFMRVNWQGLVQDYGIGPSDDPRYYDFRYGVVIGQLDPENPWRTNCPNCLTALLATNSIIVTKSLFTTTLSIPTDYLSAGLGNGSNVFLEFAIRTNGGGAFTTLAPLQPLNATPYAVVAQSVVGPVSASSLVGPIPPDAIAGTYGNVLKLSNSGNVFAGDGALLANVNASTLGGFGPCNLPCYWNILGNSGTDPAVNFLGTKDNTALTIGVNGTPVLRLMPNAISPNILGGQANNYIDPSSRGSVIVGGGAASDPVFGVVPNRILGSNVFEFIGGGLGNSSSGGRNVIVGGQENVMNGANASVIGGGDHNLITHPVDSGAIVGGSHNTVTGSVDTNLPSGDTAFIGAGHNNLATNFAAFIGAGGFNVAGGAYCVVTGGTNNSALGGFSVVAGGQNNTASATLSAIGGGIGNTTTANYTTIGGGFQNLAAGQDAVVAGGSQNSATAGQSTVGGGIANHSSSSVSTIAGGSENFAYGVASTIAGGQQNTASNNWASVGGGNGNVAAGQDSVVSGGSGNRATAGQSSIGGGIANQVSGPASTIAGGQQNYADTVASTIGGGDKNRISNGADFSALSGGSGNFIGRRIFDLGFEFGFQTNDAYAAVLNGGLNNTNVGYYATLAGGQNNTIVGPGNHVEASHAVIAGGRNNQVTSINAGTVGGGGDNSASGDYAVVPGGRSGSADHYGQFAFAAGQMDYPGDAQASLFVLRRKFNASADAELYLNGDTGDTAITIPAGAVWTLHFQISAVSLTGKNFGSYEVSGVVANVGGSTTFRLMDGSGAIVGTARPIYETPGAVSWQATPYLNADGSLRVEVFASEAAKWCARIDVAEVRR